MKNKRYFVIIIFVCLISVFLFDYPKKFISRLIFSHDLSLLTHSVFYSINSEIEFDMTKKENQKKSLIVLNNFVYNFFRPEFENLDDGVSWKMLHGSSWCDGVADIFLRLAENTNTRVHMVYLYQNDGIGSHTLNLIDLDDSIKNNSELNKMYITDPHYNYYPINKQFQFVDINYMLRNKIEFSNYKKLDSDNVQLNMLQNKKRIFLTNRNYEEYSLIGKLSLHIVKLLPKKLMSLIYKFGIYINPKLEDDYKKFLYARLEHILLNYDDAIINYSKITKNNKYYYNAQYWHKRIKTSQSILTEYKDILSPLTNSTFPKNLN